MESGGAQPASSPRVLVVSEFFPPAWSAGGGASSAWNLARALVRGGARVRVVTTDAYAEPPGSVPCDRTEGGMRITTARVLRWAGGRAHRFGVAPRIVPILWEVSKNVDACVLQGFWTLPVAAASRICVRRKLPYILSALGALDSEALSRKALKKRIYSSLVASGTIKRAAAVHFASERELARSRGAIGRARAIVVPNAFEARPLEPRRGAELRGRLGLPEESRLVGMAGRIHPGKGFDVIVPALAKSGAKTHLVVFGSDHERYQPWVMDLARACGVRERVHMLGHLEPSELYRTYAAIDLLAMPSHSESFGNVIVEALSQGTPIVLAKDVPLAPYVADHDLGMVVESSDPASWAAALDRPWEGAMTIDRENAARLVARDFGLDAAGERWMEVLSGIVSRRDSA